MARWRGQGRIHGYGSLAFLCVWVLAAAAFSHLRAPWLSSFSFTGTRGVRRWASRAKRMATVLPVAPPLLGEEQVPMLPKEGMQWKQVEAEASTVSQLLRQRAARIACTSQWADGLELLERQRQLENDLGELWSEDDKRELYHYVMSACARPGNWGMALALLRRMPFSNVRPTLETLDHVHRTGVPKDVADKLWRWVLNQKAFTEEDPGGILRKRLVAQVQLGAGSEILQALESAELRDTAPAEGDVPFYRDLLCACGATSNGQLAVGLLNKMVADKLNPDAGCYGSTMIACGGAGYHEAVLDLWQRCGNLEFGPGAWRAISNAIVEVRPEWEAESMPFVIASTMEVCGNSAVSLGREDLEAARQVINRCTGDNDDWRRRLQLIGAAQRRNLEPSREMFEDAMIACKRAGNMKNVALIFDNMRRRSLRPDAHQYREQIVRRHRRCVNRVEKQGSRKACQDAARLYLEGVASVANTSALDGAFEEVLEPEKNITELSNELTPRKPSPPRPRKQEKAPRVKRKAKGRVLTKRRQKISEESFSYGTVEDDGF